MNTRIFEAFKSREQQVTEYMAGCGMKYGGDCTCGPDCRCKNCPTHGGSSGNQGGAQQAMDVGGGGSIGGFSQEPSLQVDQPMELFGMGPPAAVVHQPPTHATMNPAPLNQPAAALSPQHDQKPAARVQRNPSVYGNRGSLRGMSITSETTFGRAMSGLSALSIDWENLEDFDLEVDHSAAIQGGAPTAAAAGGQQQQRSSIRQSIMSTGSNDNAPGVSFRV